MLSGLSNYSFSRNHSRLLLIGLIIIIIIGAFARRNLNSPQMRHVLQHQAGNGMFFELPVVIHYEEALCVWTFTVPLPFTFRADVSMDLRHSIISVGTDCSISLQRILVITRYLLQ